MKSIAFVILGLTTLNSYAWADFQAYRIAPCSYWMQNSNGSGFVCQNMPLPILVPQAESIAETLKLQNDRIKELEARVKELEDSGKHPNK